LKARKKRNAKLASTAQQLRHFNIDQHGKMVLDSGIRTLRAKLHPGKQTSPNPPATLPQPSSNIFLLYLLNLPLKGIQKRVVQLVPKFG
jgi:hypothetical protein